MNRGDLGARYLNIELQSRLNGLSEPKVSHYGSTYASGDKVIQGINNYDKEVFKGILALLVPLTWKKVYFKSPMRSASWTTSLMSWMKSTWPMPPVFIRPKDPNNPAVVIPMAMLHFMLLERNLLYTGVTQGKQLVVVIAQPKALAMAVKNQRSQRRMTHFIARLNQG
jgi:exodeoxyribonuclease V alpha subunit